MGNNEVFEKLNDSTLSVVHDFIRQSSADPELRRIFNFEARQITTIYTMWYGKGLTSNMDIQNFSDLDSLDEVTRLHKKLVEMGGQPPPLTEIRRHIPKTRPARGLPSGNQ